MCRDYIIAIFSPKGATPATLVDVLEVQSVIVKRCTLPDCGSFTIAQGVGGEAPVPPIEGQPVAVRGVSVSTLGSFGV